MPLAFYNTLTKSIEPFIPLEEGKVSMYTCGPTVYDYFHIGNARTFILSDLVRRYLEFRRYNVTFVMNITDVDDKIIERAHREGTDAETVAHRYTEAFFEDAAALGIRPADVHPRATRHIDDIITHVMRLVEAGAAYVADGDVYYSVEAFPAYGKLSGKRLEDLIAGARVERDERKKNPADFALWKCAKPGEPSWDSPWGKGRPGWHIECSVMAMKHLGESFDIHAGGHDLIFPHHENEIAQSEVLTGKPLARYWIHFGFLNVEGEKMSKSLGNFFTAREILREYDAETIRFFTFQTHYRSPLNFSREGVTAAENGLKRLHALYEALGERHEGSGALDIDGFERRFIEAMDADFNAPAAFSVIFDLVRESNRLLNGAEGLRADCAERTRDFLRRTAGEVFGVLGSGEKQSAGQFDAEPFVRLVIEARQRARAEKQWALADFLRDGLRDLGVILEDGRDGTTWKWCDERNR
ncbi:MAG: cysteine--tRNA ligase [Bacteroidota bacterium]|nr:cysteine--tRNA ligase [Bacteroidota bacterium]